MRLTRLGKPAVAVQERVVLGVAPKEGEQRLEPAGGRTLRDPAGDTLRARYAVVPAALHVPGRVLGRYPNGGIVLVAPRGGVVRTGAPVRCPTS